MGAATPEMVEKRAREIAMIDERDPNEFTEADWQEARRELIGTASHHAPEEIDGGEEQSSDEHEIIPESHGHRARRGTEDGDEMLGERLVADGVEEAVHDQRVEAAKGDQAAEG